MHGRSMMRILNAILIVCFGLLLGACSGAAAPPAGSSSAGSQAPATDAPLASASSAVQASADPGGGGATTWCHNTVEEVSAALKVTVVAAVSSDAPGIGGGCFYNDASGIPLFATSTITAAGAADTFKAQVGTAGVTTIDGIGDGAVLMSAGGPLVVLKGDLFVSIGAVPSVPIFNDAPAYRAALEALARSSVDRLP